MAGDGKRVMSWDNPNVISGGDLKKWAEENGYHVSISRSTGVATFTDNVGHSFKLQNNGNFFNNGKSDTSIPGIDKDGPPISSSFIDVIKDFITEDYYTYDVSQLSPENLEKNSPGFGVSAEEAKAKAEAKAAEEAKAAAKAGASSSNALINSLLNSGLLNGGTAKQNFTVSADDIKALKASFPNYSDAQLLNLIASSPWVSKIAGGISTKPSKDVLLGAALTNWLKTAEESNEYVKDIADTNVKAKSQALLKQIQTDPELYNAVVSGLRTDAVAGTTFGQRVANALNAANTASQSYAENADALYDATGGVSEDSLAGATRTETFNNLAAGLGGYTQQQLNKLAVDKNLQANDVQDLITVLSVLSAGLDAEQAQRVRAALDNKTRADLENSQRQSKAGKDSAESIAGSEANADYAATRAGLAQQMSGSGMNLTAPKTNAPGTSKGTFNKISYEETPYIDESLYNLLLTDDYKKVLTDEMYDRFTRKPTEEELAAEYGLDYLLNQDDTVKQYTDFQAQANKQSDSVFNNAQKAYLSAIAAGDKKTVDQLSKLALTAGQDKGALYNTAAYSNQLKQQNIHSDVGNRLYYDKLLQQLLNKKSMNNAVQAGRNQWNAWVGDGSANAAGNGFRQSFNKSSANATLANSAYGDLMLKAMQGQTNFNDVMEDIGRSNNLRLADYAAELNRLNASGAASNSRTNAVIHGINDQLNVQQQINNNILNR